MMHYSNLLTNKSVCALVLNLASSVADSVIVPSPSIIMDMQVHLLAPMVDNMEWFVVMMTQYVMGVVPALQVHLHSTYAPMVEAADSVLPPAVVLMVATFPMVPFLMAAALMEAAVDATPLIGMMIIIMMQLDHLGMDAVHWMPHHPGKRKDIDLLSSFSCF